MLSPHTVRARALLEDQARDRSRGEAPTNSRKPVESDEPYLVTLRRTLGVLTAAQPAPSLSTALRLGTAGAESNVAVGVNRLGGRATWIGRKSDDELGELVLRDLRTEEVTALAMRDPVPTSLLLKEKRTSTQHRIRYYRTATAVPA